VREKTARLRALRLAREAAKQTKISGVAGSGNLTAEENGFTVSPDQWRPVRNLDG
jgi:hypothetical protein